MSVSREEKLAEILGTYLITKELHKSKKIRIENLSNTKSELYNMEKVPSNEELYEIFWGHKFKYQPPQLSDLISKDIKFALKHLAPSEMINLHPSKEEALNKVEQHIQAITNENSELKEENERLIHDTMALNRINKSQANEHKRLKEAIEASQTNAQSLGEWTLQQWDKLNKISSIMDSAYKQSENGMNFDSTYYFNQILKVLKEETHGKAKNSD